MRYFLPQPPVPASWRRRMIALGSGEPTRAICSSLIAQAFESVDYPILPEVRRVDEQSRREILHIRHHSLYAPRDFDVSPFFAIVKPTIETGFDYKRMTWADNESHRPSKCPRARPGPETWSGAQAVLSAEVREKPSCVWAIAAIGDGRTACCWT